VFADGGKDEQCEPRSLLEVRENMVAPMSVAIEYCALKLARCNEKVVARAPPQYQPRCHTNVALCGAPPESCDARFE